MFTFSDVNLREATEADRAHCEQWIAADPDHAGRVSSDFFIGEKDANGDLKPDPGIERMVLEDKFGEPIFYFRQQRALRIDIQFGPAFTKEERRRNLDGMLKGFTWLGNQARNAGFRQIIFQSTVSSLVQLCRKRFGFQESTNELVCSLPPLPAHRTQEKAEHRVQQNP